MIVSHNRLCLPLLLLALLVLSMEHLVAETIYVDRTKGDSITAAIRNATNGDTVLVGPGVYSEPTITITKQLVVIGIDFPVLDGHDKVGLIEVMANNVTISGLKLIRPGRSDMTDISALKVIGATGVVVKSNKIDQAYFGVYLQDCRNCLVYNNYITGKEASEMMTANGIHCWKCDSVRIFQNNISGHRDGIYFEFVTNSAILGNTSHDNVRYGLHFMFSDNDVYTSNIFERNGAGVAVMFTKGVHMFFNKFRFNWGGAAYGLLLKEISDSRVENNVFENNTAAIMMEGASRMIVSKNIFISNGWAAQVQASCMDNIFTENNFFGNSFDISTNGNMVLTNFSGNYWDRYDGYDLNKDGVGDVPFRPVGLYSVLIERIPSVLILYRSPFTSLLEKAEKAIPGLTPIDLVDSMPLMKSVKL